MIILTQRALRGPNRYSRKPCIYMALDIGDLEGRPSDKIDGFTGRLVELIPSLQEHRCSIGEPGGFIQRLNRGTWAGHIVEHVAIELQCLAGMELGFGKTYDTKDKGIYHVVYRYRVESAGLYAGRKAVELVDTLIQGRQFDLASAIIHLKELRELDMLGPSIASIVEESNRRGIPFIRLNDSSFVQLGYGVRQRRIQSTMTDRTSALGVEIADEKFRTKELLEGAGVPVPKGGLVSTLEDALRVADEIGFPVAVKPEVGNHGKGITAHVSSRLSLEHAFKSAEEVCSQVIIEQSLSGYDFRVLVINGHFVAAALREPACVVGDGKSTIESLIAGKNKDPRRGDGHEKELTKILVDKMTKRLLKLSDLTPQSILPDGEKFYLKSTANLSTGGTATNVTDEVHPEVRFMCERIARIIGLDCVGIDIVAPDLTTLLADGSGVVEVNAAPGFRMHLYPTIGTAVNVARPYVNMLFPEGGEFDVPIIAVTGTNGKTTTTRLIAHAIKYAGGTVGLAGTNGVEINGINVVSGDYSGPEGARIILTDASIDHAVVEVARGGIIRRGLGFMECNIAVLLNIQKDHLGCDGVENLEDLALVKSTILEVVKEDGVAVLNADDSVVVGLRERTRGKVIYFSMNNDNPVILDHLQSGGTTIVLKAGNIVIRSADKDVVVLSITDIPISFRGVVSFNIANAMAAVGALHGLGMGVEMIRNGLQTFHPSVTQNPGRMNIIDFRNFKVVVDYAHNVPAVAALGAVLPQITLGRKIVVAHGTGNRNDNAIIEFGGALAAVYDYIIVADADRRDRAPGITTELVRQGAIEYGFDEKNIEVVIDPVDALDRAFELVEDGDLIVVQVDEVGPMVEVIMRHFETLIGRFETSSSRLVQPVLEKSIVLSSNSSRED